MKKTYTHSSFLEKIVTQYFEVKSFYNIERRFKTIENNVEKNKIIEYFEERSKMYNTIDYYIPKAALNIVEINAPSFIQKSNLNFDFFTKLNNNIKFFIFEYVKPHYNEFRNGYHDYAICELISDIYAYDTLAQKVIATIEVRDIVSNFKTYFQQPFIGYISTDVEYRKLGIATFMTYVVSFYLWILKRKKLYSSTTISPERLPFYRKHKKNSKWILRSDYYNSYTNQQQERYEIKPLKLNITVKDSNQEFSF